MVDGAIIYNGAKTVLEGVEVHTWHDHGMFFSPENSAVPRRGPPRWLCFHSTASEREGLEGARLFFNSMIYRRPVPLSVEFLITNEGTIWQFCDPAEVRCRHCSRINEVSIGVEVSGYLWDKPGRSEGAITEQRPRYRTPPLHGGSWRPWFYSYLPEQQRAANALADAVCRASGIPRRVEGAPWARRPKGYFEEAEGGVCGHIHAAWLSRKSPKCDPGTKPLELLAEALGEAQ